jgi:hypothetical protein
LVGPNRRGRRRNYGWQEGIGDVRNSSSKTSRITVGKKKKAMRRSRTVARSPRRTTSTTSGSTPAVSINHRARNSPSPLIPCLNGMQILSFATSTCVMLIYVGITGLVHQNSNNF